MDRSLVSLGMSKLETNQVVIALVGLPASGKTRLAKVLAENKPFTVVSRDKIRSAMFPDCLFTESEKQAAYNALKIALETNLKLGKSVIIDGMTFSQRKVIDEIDNICATFGIKVYFFHLNVKTETAKSRLASQTDTERARRPDRNLKLIDKVAERFETLPDFVISMNGEQDTNFIANEIISMIS